MSMVDSNLIPFNSDVSESNSNSFKRNIKGRKKIKLKDENELEIYNLKNEINELYIDLGARDYNKKDILKEYEKILTNLKRIILLSNTDTGSYYMAGLCCYEVYQHLIENKSNNLTDIEASQEKNMEFQYLKLSHDFYSCFVRLVPGNKDVIEILLHQNMTLLNEYGNLINIKDQRVLQKEISRNLDFLFKYNLKNFKMSIKNFPSYLKQIWNNKYTKLKLECADKYGLSDETIRVLIKLVLFDVTDKCYYKLQPLDTIFDTPLISFDLSSCQYLKKLQEKYSNTLVLNDGLFNRLLKTNNNSFNNTSSNNTINIQIRMKEISDYYGSIFENHNTNKKSIIISQQLKLLLKYLKYKIYYTEEEETTYPTLHELLSTCIVYIFYSFQIRGNSVVIKAVNLLNNKQNKYLKNFFKKEWNSLKIIALISHEKYQYESSKRHTNKIKIRNNKRKQIPNFTIDFIKSEYEKANLSLLLTLNNFYLKNEKYEIFLELTDLLIEKLTNLSNIFIRKALFNLFRKKAMVFKRLNRNVKDQINILLNAHELFPDENRINIQLSELYEEIGDMNLTKYFMDKSNKQRNISTIISEEIEFDKSLIIEGDLEELLIKLKEMFPRLQKIYNENLSGHSNDYSIFNNYLTISRHMIRMIFRCQEAQKSIKQHLFDKKLLNIKLMDWIQLIQAHIICCTCLFDLKNFKTLTCKIEGEKLIYDSLIILDKAFDISFIRNFNNKTEGVKIILQIMKIIAKYNMVLKDNEYKMNLLETFLTQGKRLIFTTSDTSFLYLIVRFVETINFNERYVGFKSPLQSMSTSNFARYVLRILGRKLQNDKIQNRLEIIEQFLICCSLYNIYTYTFKKLDDLFKDLENTSKVPYKLYLIFAITCFNHSRSRKLIDRDYTIKRGFDALFKSLDIKLEKYRHIENEIQNMAEANRKELEVVRLECLSTIYTIKYNIGRAYHNFCLSGIAEKYYWECRFSPNFNCRIASFINLTVIYQESKNEMMLDKLYAEYFC